MNQPRRRPRLLAGGLAVLAGVAVTALAVPELDQAAAAPSRAALQQRAVAQQKVIRAQRTTIRILRTRNQDQADTIQTVGVQLADANAAAASAQSALFGSVTTQIAALPPDSISFSSVFSALCSRVRIIKTDWHCSTYFASGYSSYSFDRY